MVEEDERTRLKLLDEVNWRADLGMSRSTEESGLAQISPDGGFHMRRNDVGLSVESQMVERHGSSSQTLERITAETQAIEQQVEQQLGSCHRRACGCGIDPFLASSLIKQDQTLNPVSIPGH